MNRLLFNLLLLSLFSCNGHKPGNQSSVVEKKQTLPWKGTWERDGWQTGASLDITNNSADTLGFVLQAFSGGAIGDLDGKAVIKGNVATYQYTVDSPGCVLTFKIFGDSLITIEEEAGFCGAGIGVTYAGKYFKSEYRARSADKHKDQSETLLTLGIVANTTQDSIFRLLVKKDYTLFLNSTQLIEDNDDLDNLHAVVHSSGVQGLFTFQENIVMIDSSHRIWAAVIDDEKVLYYTNSTEFTNKLPKTIEDWRSRFKEYPVIYKSGPQETAH